MPSSDVFTVLLENTPKLRTETLTDLLNHTSHAFHEYSGFLVGEGEDTPDLLVAGVRSGSMVFDFVTTIEDTAEVALALSGAWGAATVLSGFLTHLRDMFDATLRTPQALKRCWHALSLLKRTALVVHNGEAIIVVFNANQSNDPLVIDGEVAAAIIAMSDHWRVTDLPKNGDGELRYLSESAEGDVYVEWKPGRAHRDAKLVSAIAKRSVSADRDYWSARPDHPDAVLPVIQGSKLPERKSGGHPVLGIVLYDRELRPVSFDIKQLGKSPPAKASRDKRHRNGAAGSPASPAGNRRPRPQ